MGKGNMLAEEDAYGHRHFTTSVSCVSNKGELLAIKIHNFYQRIKANEETWQYIKKQSKIKERQII